MHAVSGRILCGANTESGGGQRKGMRTVKVSAAMARLKFNGCDPDYIRRVCHASCCQSSTHTTGTMITIHPSEEPAIAELGGRVVGGLLQPKSGCRVCPFKTPDHLCGIHFSGKKPFGCIASPFTLNKTGTLIVRNRYKLLRCFDGGKRVPAYVAFRASLDLIFGPQEAERICNHLAAGGGDIKATISDANYEKLMTNDEIKHAATNRLTWVQGDRPEEMLDETSRKNLAAQPQSGTSIFDPVLCEIAYKWFCPPGGSVLDPFAGGSVRGIVASKCGLDYTGIDLRSEQVEANREQAERICAGGKMPNWICADSITIPDLAIQPCDLVFSCPPYGDLEVYSDDKRDLSTMPPQEFLAAYRKIISAAVGLLRDNRFAVFVVGDYRGASGFYCNLPAETIAAFQQAGATLYNEAVLVTSIGSLPIRVAKQMQSGRKLGKTHQNVLVFFKGDPRKIKTEFGDCQFGEADDPLLLSPSPDNGVPAENS